MSRAPPLSAPKSFVSPRSSLLATRARPSRRAIRTSPLCADARRGDRHSLFVARSERCGSSERLRPAGQNIGPAAARALAHGERAGVANSEREPQRSLRSGGAATLAGAALLTQQADDRRLRDVLEVLRIDEADLPHAAVDEHGVRADAVREEAHTVQQLAIRHAGRDETDVLSTGEVIGAIDLVLVGDPHLLRTRALLITAEAKPSEDLPADAFQRRRGDDALRRSARAHDRVQAG